MNENGNQNINENGEPQPEPEPDTCGIPCGSIGGLNLMLMFSLLAGYAMRRDKRMFNCR